jgi:hypothetical protein
MEVELRIENGAKIRNGAVGGTGQTEIAHF